MGQTPVPLHGVALRLLPACWGSAELSQSRAPALCSPFPSEERRCPIKKQSLDPGSADARLVDPGLADAPAGLDPRLPHAGMPHSVPRRGLLRGQRPESGVRER